jgi:hypothetical protein
MPPARVRALRGAYQQFGRTRDISRSMTILGGLPLAESPATLNSDGASQAIKREDLHLVCYDFVWS